MIRPKWQIYDNQCCNLHFHSARVFHRCPRVLWDVLNVLCHVECLQSIIKLVRCSKPFPRVQDPLCTRRGKITSVDCQRTGIKTCVYGEERLRARQPSHASCEGW